jgi:hypothetical protein
MEHGGLMEKSITIQINELNQEICTTLKALYSYESDKQYQTIKKFITDQKAHADKLKTDKGKNKIYLKIENYKRCMKEHFEFDYSAHLEKLNEYENKLKDLQDRMNILEAKRYAESMDVTPYISTNISLPDKVWNRRSNR